MSLAVPATGVGSFGAAFLFIKSSKILKSALLSCVHSSHFIALNLTLAHCIFCLYDSRLVRDSYFVCQGVLGRTIIDHVINGAGLSKSSFSVMSYCCDRFAMLLHGLVTRCESSMK